MRYFRTVILSGLAAAAVAAAPAGQLSAQEPVSGGWICGKVMLENGTPALQAKLSLLPGGEPNASSVASSSVDRAGDFCFKDLAAGFYQLRVVVPRWPPQPPRRVEAREGLVNRLSPNVEVQFEPGDPSIRFEESFDGMSVTSANTLLRELMGKGDTTSLREAVRRFLPKRGVTIDLDRLIAGFDPKPLAQESMRLLDEGVLPPLKTARYAYLIGELGDVRTEEILIPFLLQRLTDGRPLPLEATLTDNPVYVSDVVIQEISRYAGKDFRWKYGVPALQNSGAISRARSWWRDEIRRRNEGN